MSADSSKPPENAAKAGPTKFGKYDIEKKIGAGGMGAVYLAVDRDLKRTVALKILPKDRAENPLLVKRFKSEGQTAAHLQHKNIIAVHDSGEIDGFLYLALEYVDGVDLLEWMRKRGVLPVRRSVDIIRQVAEALQHAQEKQIVHRDIKPSNIMIKPDGTVKLADMGLARFVDDTVDTSITRAGTTVGTVDYMSPEQARDSRAADIRSDIYSLGCSWFHMLTGSIPYPTGGLTNKLRSHAVDPVPDPRAFNSNVPAGVAAVMQRMMAKRPEDRYPSAAALIADLVHANLTRGEISKDLFAALSEDAPIATDSRDFILQPGRQIPSNAGNVANPTQADVELTADTNTPGNEDHHIDVRAVPVSGAGGRPPGAVNAVKGGPPKDTAGKEAADGKPARPGTAGSNADRNARPQPAKAKSTKLEPLPQKMSGSGVSFDLQRLALPVGGVLILGALIWGTMALFSSTSTSDPVVALETPAVTPDQEHLEPQPEPKPQPQPVPITPDPERPEVIVEGETLEFPGVEDAVSGDELLARVIPDWLRAGWGGPRTEGVPVMVIDSHGRTRGSFRTLAEAMSQRRLGSVVFEFAGAGPYRVGSLTFDAPLGAVPHDITFRGMSGGKTTLVIDANSIHDVWISVARGVLHLEHLDLVLIPAATETAVDLVRLLDSDLTATACTWTVLNLDSSSPPTSISRVNAVHALGTSASKNRVLLRDCVSRGRLSAVVVDAATCDVVCGNCLLVSNEFPVLEFTGATPATMLSEPPRRRIALLGSTLIGSADLFRFQHAAAVTLTPVELRLRRTLCVGTGPASCVTSLQNWPLSDGSNLESPVAAEFTLEYEHLRFVNCPQLTALNSGTATAQSVNEVTGWRQFWKQPLSPEAVRVANISDEQLTSLSAAVWVSQLEAETGPVDSGKPFFGVNPNGLQELDSGMQERVHTAATRRRLPAGFGDPEETRTAVRFDLKRAVQLNDFLNGAQCPDGTTVICFGAGLYMLPPVVLQGKRLRLEFEQAEGKPLMLQPVADTAAEEWFRMQNGHLDLVNAPLQIPSTARRKYPKTILKLVDASGSLQRCELRAVNGSASHPLVGAENQVSAAQSLLISDSVLLAPQNLLEFSATGVQVELANSLLGTTATAVRCGHSSSAQQSPSQLFLYRCALVATHAVELAEAPAAGKINCFVRDSLFFPGNTPDSSHRVLWAPQSATARPGLAWWENDCGYSSQYSRWCAVADSTEIGSFDEDRELYPPSHYHDVVLGDAGVLLLGPLPAIDALTPAAMQLEPACWAGTWAEDGGPLGVRLPLGCQLLPPGSPPPEGTPTIKPTVLPGRFRPDF